MKTTLLFWFTIIVISAFVCMACNKTIHDRRSTLTESPESREFFACRINGYGIVSEARTGNVYGNCSYGAKYLGKGGKSFQLYSDHHVTICRTLTVGITLDSVELEEGQTYALGAAGDKKYFGAYFNSECAQNRVDLFTNDTLLPAHITITRLDTVKHVVTGKFLFAVQDQFGTVYQITDGLFDRHYTP